MNLPKRKLPILFLPLAFACLGGAQQAPAESASPRLIRATGTAKIPVKPDQAEINVGVVTEAATAKAAASANAEESTRVIEQLKKAGGSSTEIRTVNYSVHPRYRHSNDGREPEIVGFTASNVVRVKLDDLERVGELIDAATQTGANQIHGIEFTLQNERAARAQALQQATKEAMASAAAMAAAVGAKLGRVRSVEEQGTASPPQPLRTMAMAEARAVSTPVEPGTIEVPASVTVTVEME
jgi:hypothetical protein